jgi:hypothetical protein
MALTKVKLIADGVITSANLDASHGITTSDIGEGSNLYYTDSRVSSYLSTNGFATQTDIVAAITDSAPVTLDTLNELAAALGDDPNFATTTATSLGLKAPLASPSFTGNATFGGSVGIGGSPPSDHRLQIHNADAAYARFALTNSASGSASGDGLKFQFENLNGIIKNQENGYLTFGTNGRETDLRIGSSGNVGIGAAPSTSNKLHIQQAKSGSSAENYDLLRFNLTGTGAIGDSSSIVWYSTSGTKTAGIEGISGQNNILYGELAFNVRKYTTDSFDEVMRINNRGDVGIGETSPNGKLDIKQEMKAGTTAAFTDPHLRLSVNNNIDNTGFVGMTFATSTANNYGFSWGALRTTSALGGMHLRYHGNSASGTDIFNIDYVGNVTIASTRYIRSDSSGGYLIIQGGATYPGGRIEMYGGSNAAAGIIFSTGTTTTSPTERMRIDSSGNVGIGGNPIKKLDVVDTVNGAYSTNTQQAVARFFNKTNDGTVNSAFINLQCSSDNEGSNPVAAIGVVSEGTSSNNGACVIATRSGGGILERMRITSGGYLNAGAYTSSSNTHHKIVTTRASSETFRVENNSTTPYGQIIRYGAAAPDTTDNWFLVCEDQFFSRLIIWSNGNVINRNNSYGGYSDIKLKENIVDATPKLNDLMKVKVRNYNLIGDDKKQIGVIAQELEEVFPNMIDESIDFENKEVTDEEGNVSIEKVDLGTTTKSVKYSVFVPMLIKSIQELKAEIELLKTQINN